MRLEAPTGQPLRAWTDAEREECAAAMRSLAAREQRMEDAWGAWIQTLPESVRANITDPENTKHGRAYTREAFIYAWLHAGIE